jgi:hypothetical protein
MLVWHRTADRPPFAAAPAAPGLVVGAGLADPVPGVFAAEADGDAEAGAAFFDDVPQPAAATAVAARVTAAIPAVTTARGWTSIGTLLFLLREHRSHPCDDTRCPSVVRNSPLRPHSTVVGAPVVYSSLPSERGA